MASSPSAAFGDLKSALFTRLRFVFLSRTRKASGSKTLAEALEGQIPEGKDLIVLFVPHYWAVPYHEGTKETTLADDKKMIFFPNPADDPRIAGGYPVRASEIQHLTPDEFRDLKGKYRVIRKRRAMPGNKFFPRGAEDAVTSGDVPFTVTATMDEFMRINFPPIVEQAAVLVI